MFLLLSLNCYILFWSLIILDVVLSLYSYGGAGTLTDADRCILKKLTHRTAGEICKIFLNLRAVVL